MRLLVTGGAGFIGSNFIRYMIEEYPGVEVVNFDALTYAGNLDNLEPICAHPRYRFVQGDIADTEQVKACAQAGFDALINLAAETHVDRSILDAAAFVRTNLVGTQVLLEAARRHRIGRFVQVSTDEVYGSLGPHGAFSESSPLAPNSPYAASKAGADLLVRSYGKTYGLDTVTTRCSNNYGPCQFPEKLIPLMILNALEDKPLPVYGDGLHSRDWIHVRDHCRALTRVLEHGRSGEIYNIGGGGERKNLEVVSEILRILGKPDSLIRFVEDRPAHDRRYAIDARHIRETLGWTAQIGFEDGLRQTVHWYQSRADWVKKVRSGAYRNYYSRMYDYRARTLSGREETRSSGRE